MHAHSSAGVQAVRTCPPLRSSALGAMAEQSAWDVPLQRQGMLGLALEVQVGTTVQLHPSIAGTRVVVGPSA
eukprot:6694027-Alexandrium_andersonii.AAC.1